VRAYSQRRESVVWYRAKLYAIREEQQARLHVVTAPRWKATDGAVARAPGRWVTEPLDAPLGAVRAEGQALYFPGEQSIQAAEIRRAELAIDGEPPDGVRPGREPPDRRRWSYRRFALGLELGGPAYGQVVLRIRATGPLHVEFGALGMGVAEAAGVNASTGLVLDAPVGRRWSVFGGAGAGCGAYFMASGDGEAASGGRVYGYARAGVAWRVGFDERDQLGFEGALWIGVESNTHTLPFVWPVPGFFWLRTL